MFNFMWLLLDINYVRNDLQQDNEQYLVNNYVRVELKITNYILRLTIDKNNNTINPFLLTICIQCSQFSKC